MCGGDLKVGRERGRPASLVGSNVSGRKYMVFNTIIVDVTASDPRKHPFEACCRGWYVDLHEFNLYTISTKTPIPTSLLEFLDIFLESHKSIEDIASKY